MPGNRAPSQVARAAAFGARIRQLRRAANLTQRELALKIPMSPGEPFADRERRAGAAQ